MNIARLFSPVAIAISLTLPLGMVGESRADYEGPVRAAAPTTQPESVSSKGIAGRAASAKPTTRRSSRKTATKIPPSVLASLKEIRREFELGTLRKAPDYFDQTPNAEMTGDVVISLLQRRQGTSAPMDAYLKWQVLSVLPKETPEQYVIDLVSIYRDAPGFEPRPGLSPDGKRQLDRELRKAPNGQDVVRRLNAAVAEVDALNRPVVAYRDALLERLPDSYDSLEAALRDLYQRAEAGMDVGQAGDTIMQRIRQWAQQTDSIPDLRAMASLLDRLRRMEMPTYYENCHFSRDSGGNVWDERHPDLNRGGRIDDTLRAIAQKTGQPVSEITGQGGQKTNEHGREKRRN